MTGGWVGCLLCLTVKHLARQIGGLSLTVVNAYSVEPSNVRGSTLHTEGVNPLHCAMHAGKDMRGEVAYCDSPWIRTRTSHPLFCLALGRLSCVTSDQTICQLDQKATRSLSMLTAAADKNRLDAYVQESREPMSTRCNATVLRIAIMSFSRPTQNIRHPEKR